MVQYCFTSTQTRRLVRTDSPGRPPRLSNVKPGTAREPPSHWRLTSDLFTDCRGWTVGARCGRTSCGWGGLHGQTLEHDGLHAAVCWRRNACCSSTTLPALSVERLKTAPARRSPTSSIRTRHNRVTVQRCRQLQRFSRTESASDSSGCHSDDVSPVLKNSNTCFLGTLHYYYCYYY